MEYGINQEYSIEFSIQQTIEKKKMYEMAQSLLGMNESEQEESLRRFWNEERDTLGYYTEKPEKKIWVPFFQKYWRVWDSWAVGILFLKILQKSFLLPSFGKQWNRHGDTIRRILKGLLQSNPKKRLTAASALELLR